MRSKPKLELARPSTALHPSRAADGESRLTVNIPESLHRAMKVRAAERGITVRTLVLEALDKAGIR